MKRWLLDLSLALLALVIALVPGSVIGFQLAQRGPGLPMEADLDPMFRAIHQVDGPIIASDVGSRDYGGESLGWSMLTLTEGREAALLARQCCVWSEFGQLGPGLISYEHEPFSLRLKVRP